MNKSLLAGTALVACVGWCAATEAQVAYQNSALNGCYATRAASIDTGSTTVGTASVGTLCFDGNGNIVGTTATPALSGRAVNTEGNVNVASDQTGTYSVKNQPGDGMGVFQDTCTIHQFVLRNVDSNGLAHGFNYILTRRKDKKGCNGGGLPVIEGSGEYQGPLK